GRNGEVAKHRATAAIRQGRSASTFLFLRTTSLFLSGADRLHADPWIVQPVGSFLRSAVGHQSLARPLSFSRRVALDVLLPHRCPDHASGSTTGTQFRLRRHPGAAWAEFFRPRLMEPADPIFVVITGWCTFPHIR